VKLEAPSNPAHPLSQAVVQYRLNASVQFCRQRLLTVIGGDELNRLNAAPSEAEKNLGAI
jgi:hypothetical protein